MMQSLIAHNYKNDKSIEQKYIHENDYIEDISFDEFLCIAERSFQFLTKLIDSQRMTGPAFENYLSVMNEMSWEFEGISSGGRGAAYNLAQKNAGNRQTGIISLLKCFSESFNVMPIENSVILDALGGNGTIARFVKSRRIKAPKIVSSDLSSYMVKSCLSQELPCIRQSATQSLLKDSVLDGVLIAYGSHHLDSKARMQACAEAFRTVKNGGRLVLHDFEIGTPAADWFDKVVHPYSRTGHPHPHFTKQEMHDLLRSAGFGNVMVFNMDDPFILEGNSVEEARHNALIHMYYMYDLVKLADNPKHVPELLERLVKTTLGEIEISQTGSSYCATIPRQAIVAIGTKVT